MISLHLDVLFRKNFASLLRDGVHAGVPAGSCRKTQADSRRRMWAQSPFSVGVLISWTRAYSALGKTWPVSSSRASKQCRYLVYRNCYSPLRLSSHPFISPHPNPSITFRIFTYRKSERLL